MFWVIAIILAYDLRQDTFDAPKGLLLGAVVLLVALAIARFTTRLLVRPLRILQLGIHSVCNGRLAPIQISQTGDEVELLGEQFNRMVQSLAASKVLIQEHETLLEERIHQRTKELEETSRRAEEASNAKSEFLANMSHELRTPMNGILGMIDITMEGPLSEEQRDQLETAQRCAYSLLSLLNDLLDLSKIEAGKMTLERIAFDIRSMVEDCVRAHAPVAHHKGIRIEHQIASDVPREVIGDPLRIRQIMANLVSNAVKFTEHGFVAVELGCVAIGCDEVRLTLTVRDSGPGILPETLPYIFDKFTQADGSISRRYGGTGLGLAITKKLAQLHDGDIHVESSLGRGTTFTVDLKCGAPVGATNQEPARQSQAAGGTTDASPARILVVEDNQVNQKVVMAVLRKRGFTFELANDGREALSKLENGTFDLVLMDVQMPVLDGLEATRLIRQQPRWAGLPIVAMTAHAMNGDREKCLGAGMTGYISKPVHPSHLLEVIDQHLAAGCGKVQKAVSPGL